jgi:LuxR family quorum-sensing system transcriptional regulator SinR
MGSPDAYFDLLDRLEQQETLDPPEFLARLQAAFDTGPVIYLNAMVSSGHLRPSLIHHSHRHNTQQLARSLARKQASDQILRVFAALEPIELHSWKRTASRDHVMLGYPLPGRQSCLLVELRTGRAELSAWRRMHDRNVLSLGSVLNARLARMSAIDDGEKARRLPLTRRERETLAWIAAGKSYWEAAVILGISERTIRHFMANARMKLDVVNNAQAVAEAVWRGIIPRLVEPKSP